MPKVKPFVLGVTGGIASGKSTVMRILARRGIRGISSDELAHACIRRGRPSYRAILKVFGNGILSKGQIDRRKLGVIVFASPTKRKVLERIVHPCVIKGLKAFIHRHPRKTIALDIPLLFESRLIHLVNRTIVVYCTPAQQVARLRRRSRLSRSQALARVRAQMSLSRKRARADIVLYNTGTLKQLHRHVASDLEASWAL